MAQTTATQTGYTGTAKLLHWLMAFIWIAVWILGILAVYWRDELNPDHGLTVLHKALASTLIFLIAIRLLWRFTHPAPPSRQHEPADAAWCSHWASAALCSSPDWPAPVRLVLEFGSRSPGHLPLPVQTAGTGGSRRIPVRLCQNHSCVYRLVLRRTGRRTYPFGVQTPLC